MSLRAARSETTWERRRGPLLRLAGIVVFGLSFVGFVAFSTVLYHRDFLAEDFGTYNQAWTLIGQGHLNPYDTIFTGFPFWKADLDVLGHQVRDSRLIGGRPPRELWGRSVL
jgi:hypothetical protein